MVIFLFQFLLLLTAKAAGFGPAIPSYQERCKPAGCRNGQPLVRYPFRLKGRQPDDCGAKGFDLSCDNKNQTVLELPTSVKLMVKRIDYVNQKIQVSDEHNCVQNQVQNLSLSASPFLFMSNFDFDSRPRNFTLFNCSADNGLDDYNSNDDIPCLGGQGFYIQYVGYDYSYADLLYCRKTIDILNVPEGILSVKDNNFYFNWSEPACGLMCEAHGQGCRPKSNSSGIECFHVDRDDKGIFGL
ncbi:hypothetical protein COLO4_35604 [Corchorus olitorius]|uniref:RING-type E3 ubiquitin transferase n=1 Tax=Corchorus olitorius TaxID=93759 RepID=A0A1R3GET0_9ROSI|nr:hypothetical protein COLO4_35604 [Corchorus olitorius]